MLQVIVGNKCDLEANRRVTTQAGEELAKSIGASYFEASAKVRTAPIVLWLIKTKMNTGIEPVFLEIGKLLKAEHARTPPSGAAPSKVGAAAPVARPKQASIDLAAKQAAPASGGCC